MLRRLLPAVACLVLLPAVPIAAQAAQTTPPKTWVDKDTGHRVWRLTDEPNSDGLKKNDSVPHTFVRFLDERVGQNAPVHTVARAATSARMNSGVEPQQPPTNDAPASRSALKCEAKYSAVVA